jgi:hypothetical protein
VVLPLLWSSLDSLPLAVRDSECAADSKPFLVGKYFGPKKAQNSPGNPE